MKQNDGSNAEERLLANNKAKKRLCRSDSRLGIRHIQTESPT